MSFTLPSTMRGFPLEPNPNPNPQQQQQAPPAKKKRNQPGTPDPEAEVIALSPKTLMATNRFVCEICNKGFQRDQNLQLHRRGHNLPWKLRQRSNKEPRKRVYVCPDPTCVHHDPARALGDLTGIKKHFSRKHGEKRWKCEKCSKRYAVQSDWKAHSKTCGTREYKCDCGTLFSRKDSFITHRAFCDALTKDAVLNCMNLGDGARPILNYQELDQHHHLNTSGFLNSDSMGLPEMFQRGSGVEGLSSLCSPFGLRNEMNESGNGSGVVEGLASLYSSEQNHQPAVLAESGHLSATALLQKAATMSSISSSSSFLMGRLSSSRDRGMQLGDSQSGLERDSESFQELMGGGASNVGGLMAVVQEGNEKDRSMATSTMGAMRVNSMGEEVGHGLTRDFLGLGGDGPGRSFMQQELAKFASIGSPMNLSCWPSFL